MENKELELLEYLLSFATQNKQELIGSRLLERTRHITVILEDIYQPQNASAVLRTADCFGVQDVHVIENTNEYAINPRVVHGAAKWLSLHKYNEVHDNTTDCIQKLKKKVLSQMFSDLIGNFTRSKRIAVFQKKKYVSSCFPYVEK